MFRHVLTLGLLSCFWLASPIVPATPAQAAPLEPRATAADPDARRPGTQALLGHGPTARALAVESEYDAVWVPDAAPLNPRTSMTIELWIKRTPTPACGSLVSKGRGSGYWLGVCGGRLRFTAGSASVDGAAALPEGRWVHVAATFDGASVAFFVNGQLDRAVALGDDNLPSTNRELVIGADAAVGAFFPGGIDHVRLWSVARSEAEIRDHMAVGLSAQAGLIGQWPLDGNARDLAGGHDGRAGSGAFSYDGALPRDITLPLTDGAVAVDGRCDPVEYGSAERVALEGNDPLTVYVQVTALNIHVCALDMPKPASANGFLAAAIDRNLSRDARAQPGDYRVLARYSGTPAAEEADGLGGWRALTLPTGSWEAARVTTNDRWSAELRIARSILEPPRDPDAPYAAGLAIVYSGVRSAGDELPWPPGAGLNAPGTWSTASLAEVTGFAPRYAFTGVVHRLDPDGPPVGVAGVPVQLVLSEDTRLRLADSTETDQGGFYRLDFQGYPPDAFLVRQANPRGMVSVSANAGSGGRVAGSDVLIYEVDPDVQPADTTFADGRFVEALSPAAPPVLRQHYLVVYAPPVVEDDLDVLVEARRAQGFVVTARSTADIAAESPGRDLAEQIRNWLKARWEAVEPEPVYALLIGRGDRIPVRDIGWLGDDHRDPRRGDYRPAWPTDWYYADVDSSWDADGDGYHGEFLGCAPGQSYRDADGEEADCPEAGSLAREGPYGALREQGDDFRMEIALGRLPVNGRGEVRRALEATVAAEAGGAEKRRAILAGGFWHFEGATWSDARQASVPGGDARSDPWVRRAWDGDRPFGADAGEALATDVLPQVQPAMTEVTRLFESTSPDGDPMLSPTRLAATAPLSAQSMAQQWLRGAGLVHLAGRGGPGGVFQARWTRDWDGDREIDQPAAPSACAGQAGPGGRVGPPCDELEVGPIVDSRMAKGAGGAPIVVANAGGTANIAWRWDGVDAGGSVIGLRHGPSAVPAVLAGRGVIAGWLGSQTPVDPGALDRFQARAAEQIAGRAQRLGDAAAVSLGDLARRAPYDPRSYGVILLGDPALQYWGSPPDTAGAWPQEGGAWDAASGSVYAGPIVPERVWQTRDPALGSPPVVGRDGNVVAAGTGAVMRVSGAGVQVSRGTLASSGVATRFAPALGATAVYVAAGGSLYAYDLGLGNRTEIRLPSGATASGAPGVAPDGLVWVPTQLGMLRVDGAGRVVQVGLAPVIGSPAWLPTGEAVWSTGDGRVQGYLVGASGEGTLREISRRDLGDLTPPVVSPAGTVFVGAADGRVHAMPEEDQEWQVDLGGPVRARPAIAPDGRLFVATAAGRVSAYAAERSELLWTTRLGVTVLAAPAVDGGQLFIVAGQSLFALDVATGKVNWTAALGGATDDRAAPVIGPDRTVYITRADQTLVAVREAGWLAAPSDVSLETNASGASVHWRDNSAAEIGFRVEVCTPDDGCALAGTTPAGVTVLDVRRLPWPTGTRFSARVQALVQAPGGLAHAGAGSSAEDPASAGPHAPAADAGADSDFGLSQPAAVMQPRPPAVAGLAAEPIASDAVALAWRWSGNTAQLQGFNVHRRVGAGWQLAAALDGDARGFEDRGLDPANVYAYQVTAVGEGGASDIAGAEVTTWRQSLASVSDLRADVHEDGVHLAWRDANLAGTGVIVERLAPGRADFETLAVLGAGPGTLVDRFDLLPGVYSYRVRPVGDATDGPYSAVTARFARVEPHAAFLPAAFQVRRR